MLDKCERVNDSLSLPSGCFLVKVYLPKRLLNRLINESTEFNRVYTQSSSESIDKLTEEIAEEESDLVMDILPETTRFHTTVSISSIQNELQTDILQDTSEFYENDTEQEIAVYVQKNSRLKLVLISLDTNKEQYEHENIIRIVSRI